VTDPELTDHILRQGRALVRAIEALGTIQPFGPFERALACLLMDAYKRGCGLRSFDFYPKWQYTMCA
jgi:hypothetical protein